MIRNRACAYRFGNQSHARCQSEVPVGMVAGLSAFVKLIASSPWRHAPVS
jgi:hypothetical protein